MLALVTILAILFWGWVFFRFGQGIWDFFTKPPITDQANPPDLRNFTAPSEADGAESSEDERREL